MGIFVNTNVTALRGQSTLKSVNRSLDTTYQRLSSGLRINSAKDDAAGLQIADRLTSQINGLAQGNRNTNDGIALAQTIEGALEETTNILQRIRTLAVQSSNGICTDDDRAAIQQEVTQLSEEINRIATQTTFAGARILDGAEGAEPILDPPNLLDKDGNIFLQVGANSGDTISLELEPGFAMFGLFQRSGYDQQNDIAFYPKLEGVPEIPVTPDDFKKTRTGLMYSKELLRWSVSCITSAQKTLGSIDDFIGVVDSARAELGAVQNRMESTIRNQSSVITNESDARSRIRDSDFAKESANLSKQNIIQQAASSMLMQANARPELGLSLLG